MLWEYLKRAREIGADAVELGYRTAGCEYSLTAYNVGDFPFSTPRTSWIGAWKSSR
jgi:hypothetical protein